MSRKTRPDPNVQDPLSEGSIGRRIWASYLAKGYKRYSFAKTLGVSYSTVDAWDDDRGTPSLEMVMKASELLDVPLNQLVYGTTGAPSGAAHAQGLGREGRLAVMNEVGASPATRSAFAAHEDSRDGRYAVFTRQYVVQWLAAYDAARNAGLSSEDASLEALKAAQTARAVAGAVAAGATRTISRDEVRAIARGNSTGSAEPRPARKARKQPPARARKR